MATRNGPMARAEETAHWVQRHFLWLLLACYALSAMWPGPGLAMRGWEWARIGRGEVPLSLPLLLLAVMLFAAALLTDLSQIRIVSHHPFVLVAAMAAVWAGPALLVLLAGWLVPRFYDASQTAGLLVGLALVASMPVANSSVGWTQSARGNLGLGLALVVLSITLSPWITPNLLTLLGMSLSEREQAYTRALVAQFSGLFFIVWVIVPTAAGLACRYVMRPNVVAATASWCALASAAALLLLNYINAAVALPRIHESPVGLLLATALLATALSVVGLAIGWGIARVLRLRTATQAALMFGLSMKHTGLALILAGAVLANQPLAILMVVLATFLQHVLAALVQWWLATD
jgi:bile acid:Na+ symporter, BASS family